MKKSWSTQFVACCISLIFLCTGIMLSFVVLFTSKTRTLATSITENYTQPIGRATSSSTIFGYIPFYFSGEASDIIPSKDNNKDYLAYRMRQGDTLSYEQDLAFSWYEKDTTNNNGVQKFFNFTFKFADKNFKSVKFILEAPAVNASKAGKVSINVEIDNAGKVKVNGTDKSETIDLSSDIKFKFNAKNKDSYTLELEKSNTSGGSNTISLGTISNVDGWYSSYRKTDKVTTTPLKLEYTMEDNVQGESVLLIKDLNGQDFTLSGGNTIVDSAIPVVVPNTSVHHFINGTTFSDNFDFKQIDVLSSTLSTQDYLGIENSSTTLEDFKKNAKNKVENRNKQIVLQNAAQNSNARAIISLQKSTTTGSGDSQTTTTEEFDINLKWYTENQKDIPILPPVEDGKMYPTMNWDNTNTNNSNNVESFQQASITATGYKETNNIINMPLGSGAYLYFGALTEVVNNTLQQNTTNTNSSYTVSKQNILYTIYYRLGESGEVQSASAAKNNELRLALNEPGHYQIILVPQYNGVAMQVNGEDINTNNVFRLAEDANNKALLSILNFHIAYSGPEVSNGTSTVSGYVGTPFYNVNIDVIALDTEVYKSWKTYTLYELVAPNKNGLTRDVIVSAMENLRKNASSSHTIADNKETYDKNPSSYIGYLREINAYNEELSETTGDNIYKWNPKSGSYSFVPQSESFYIVQVEVKSLSNPNTSAYGFQAIDVLSQADINQGHNSSWIKNNLAAVILFSISGALLILLLVLIFLPNKDKRNKRNKHLIGADSVKKEILIDDAELTLLKDRREENINDIVDKKEE